MEFTEYRSKALHIMWRKFWKQYSEDKRNLARKPEFSARQIDNICAINWKNENSIDACVGVLLDYLKEIQES